jgi:probable H4MPT-linked C1 transfer pathway protein
MRPVLGFDIGGANLKAAHTNGTVVAVPFALWKQPDLLTGRLRDVFRQMPPAEAVAVTMTGELCDCYANRREGVHRILDSVEEALAGKDAVVWQTTGQFTDLAHARRNWEWTASANWLATAEFARRFCTSNDRAYALLLDLGSTTLDLTLVNRDQAQPFGKTDSERLALGGLVYTGVMRTPLYALLLEHAATLARQQLALIPEWFATTKDVYTCLGGLPEDASDCDTADGKPRTKACAARRLMRVVGFDDSIEVNWADADLLARLAHESQMRQIKLAIQRLLRHCDPANPEFIISGAGEFLLRQALADPGFLGRIVSFAEQLGPELSRVAAAFAVAALAAERGALPSQDRVYVVKVGGSLFDVPDLGGKLSRWLKALPTRRVLLIPGGGAAVDTLRRLQPLQSLSDQSAHELALEGMGYQARLLARLLPESVIIRGLKDTDWAWCSGRWPILLLGQPEYALEFPSLGELPASWAATSDSIAAVIAIDLRADKLILLKSRGARPGMNWEEHAADGLVDEWFPKLAGNIAAIEAIDFRA